ncbi:hypothetical protein CLU79DRAFT_778960 [Phycomyces nitens]|nr:hypothetical protein CLU79DRAFT_778960 [Phycomyces nitens]
MKRFTTSSSDSVYKAKNLPPVDVTVSSPVFYIGPATTENPMSHIRPKLMGTVHFHDRKIKWNRVTLTLVGKAGLSIDAPPSALPRDHAFNSHDLQDENVLTHLQTTVPVCEIEKELIFSGEGKIDFGLHLPANLPPSVKTDHAFVEYMLVANFSAGTFFKKYRIQRPVQICRHYLPSSSAMIPSMEYHGVREWFEWSADVPKAVAIESGEIVIALRWSVEKELVELSQAELSLEEVETYRFCTKVGVHSLPPMITAFPSAPYHPSGATTSSETHFIRTPIPLQKSSTIKRPVRTHHFSPFIEIAHRCKLTLHFDSPAIEPLVLRFPIIITDYPVTNDNNLTLSQIQSSSASAASASAAAASQPSLQTFPIMAGGDDGAYVDFDLPEYTPRYEQRPDTLLTH